MSVIDEVARFTKDSGNVSSVIVTFDKAVPVGSRLIIAANHPVTGTVTGWTVTDTKGNTYTKRDSNQATPLNYQVVLFDSVVSTAIAIGDTFTIAVTGASPAKWCVQALYADDISGYDTHGNIQGTGTGVSVDAIAAAAQNNQLEVGVIAWTDATGIVNMTPAAGYIGVTKTTASPASAGRSMQIIYQYVNAAGTRNASGTLDSSQGWGAVIATYNKAAAAANPAAYIWDGTVNNPLKSPVVA